MSSLLAGLRDVEGVFGSFVLAESGQLLDRDLPAVFDDGLLTDTGPRIARLCEAVEYGGEPVESVALRFADYRLHVRKSEESLLCVITSADSNASALRMAIALVARRLSSARETPLSFERRPPGDSNPPRSAVPQTLRRP